MTKKKTRKPLGALLKDKGIIKDAHIAFAMQEQKITHERFGEILERLSIVTEYEVITTLAEQEKIPFLDVDSLIPKEEVLKLFNKNSCLAHTFLPIQVKESTLEIATGSTSDEKLAQLINRQTGLTPRFFLGEKKKIVNAVNRLYFFVENPVEQLIEKEINLLSQDTEMARGVENLIRYLLHLAVKMRATDIHVRPMNRTINVSFRVDGVMTSVLSMPVGLQRLVSSLKMKADMDIAEQRLPQDGRFSATILNNDYDFRASTIVTPQGENMVVRILPTESAVMGMLQLGFFEEHIHLVQEMFNEPFGIILLTGPTGSGKSTTLYAGIRSLDLLGKNVVTVEEPIEYDMSLLRQTQVNEKAGYTFANAIRYFLRHDPDVILVGEIRDEETASTAVSASTTGHLVLSTLHTNSAIGAIPRLRDLGIRPFLIADSLIGVVSQRLVRKICTGCREPYAPPEKEKAYLKDMSIEVLYRGKGCEACNGSGYFGRTLVYEILPIDRELSKLIDREEDLSIISENASERGFVDIFETTATKVKQGVTSVEEAARVLGHIRQV